MTLQPKIADRGRDARDGLAACMQSIRPWPQLANNAAMKLSRIAVALLLPGLAPAQQPILEVQDLLSSRLPSIAEMRRQAVLRGARQFPRPEGDLLTWHHVSGEGHLTGWPTLGSDFGFAEEASPRGIYTDESLAAVLAALRGATRSSIEFQRVGDATLVESEFPEQVAAALERVRAALPPKLSVEVRLERVRPDATTTLVAGTATFTNGCTQVIGDVERRSFLQDMDVEIAQAAATANPIIGELRYGTSVALRARPMPFSDHAVVELVVRTAAPAAGEPIQAHESIGPIERMSTRVDEAGLAFRLPRDEPTTHEWTATDGTELRLTCTASWEPRPAPAAADPRIVATSLFGAPVLGFRSVDSAGQEDEPGDATSVTELVERLRSVAGRDAVPLFEAGDWNGGGVLLLSGSGGERFQRLLEEHLARALRPAHVAVEILDVPAGAGIGAAGALPDGARVIGQLSGPVLVGLPSCVASAHEQSHVLDWEAEVAQAARIPDPKIRVVEDGWFATMELVADSGGRVTGLALDLEVDVLEELRELATSINAAMTALSAVTDDDRPPTMWLPRDVLQIELPVERAIGIDATIALDAEGRGVMRRSASSLFGPGRELVVRCTVQTE